MLFEKIYPVTCHTDHVGPGSTFVAINGYSEDGIKYIQQAIEKGATKIILDEKVKLINPLIPAVALEELWRTGLKQVSADAKAMANRQDDTAYVFVKDTRIALAELCAQALGNPAEKLKIIGITGTSGKTTTTYLIDHILRSSGYKTALLGSVKNRILDQEEEIALTTQSSDYIQMFLAQCVKKGVQIVIMEVSSHGLALNRIHGIKFDAVGFTNLSPEHMDFHPTMDHYFQTKMQLFKHLKDGGIAVINIGNDWGLKAFEQIKQNEKFAVKAFGQTAQDSFNTDQNFGDQNHVDQYFEKFELLENNLNNLKINLSKYNQIIRTDKLIGEFNAYNIVMASLICKHFGLELNKITQAIENFTGVPGRLQCHKLKNGAKAFVDYAHKPDAFEKVLKNLRPHTQNLIVVFGCGGNRDKTKRPVMGGTAAKYADFIIVTDDNPRDEDQQTIADEIIAGIPQAKRSQIMCILDRKDAIKKATELANSGSIIAILGKGHENYYLISGKKYHFDDFEEISKF